MATMIAAIWLLALAPAVLVGCGRAPEPPSVSQQPSGYYLQKSGTTAEDFERDRAKCYVQANMAKSASIEHSTAPLIWVVVLQYCMRANGWVWVTDTP